MNLILKSSFLTDQTGRVEILLDTSGIFSSLNPPPSAISPASGLLFTHTGHSGSVKEFHHPLDDSLEPTVSTEGRAGRR
jgi:hypothetical protein